ncbi:unnamed protein product [Vitrella brassicaformis CCMP3155]|uniref:Uncharacterized protein n=1 Tax=Vitrella brassicaformis (strain CCMP3155) TaxID=1169540 RepID=A0A0G4FFW3_VITBC|nr:unnamed protein product [Vitrella brassicaformis CCMP3155]|eukprot:CEM11944.1 unnamed protein product [Vitrella brassicaformis CCMP3155]
MDVWPSIAFATLGETMYRQLEATAVKPDLDFRMHRYRYKRPELQASIVYPIVDEIAEREGLTVAPDGLQITIDTVQCSKTSRSSSLWSDSRVQSKLEAMLVAQRVIDWIVERSSISWVDEAELYGGNLDDRLMRQTEATTPTTNTETNTHNAPTAAEQYVERGCSGPAGAVQRTMSCVR